MQRATPIAIVIAGTIIAIAVYLGLRASPEPPTPTSAEPPASDAKQDEQNRAQAQAQAIADVGTAVEGARASWAARCWDTADPKTRTPGKYIAALAFDADGKTVIAGVTELRGESDPGVAQCLRQTVGGLTIPAPGQRVSVEIPFALP